MKRVIEEGLGQSAANMARLERVWQMEADVIGEYKAMVGLLQSARWTIEGERIAFNDGKTASAFNEHVAAIQKLSQEQTGLTAQMQNDLASGLQK